MEITLSRNAYSPRLLARELHGLASASFIRSQIRRGFLKAHVLDGKRFIIVRAEVERWLSSLPPATAPTKYKGVASRGVGRRKRSAQGERQ